MKPPPAYLDAREVARRLAISERAAYVIMHSIDHVRVSHGGRSIRVTEKAFAVGGLPRETLIAALALLRARYTFAHVVLLTARTG